MAVWFADAHTPLTNILLTSLDLGFELIGQVEFVFDDICQPIEQRFFSSLLNCLTCSSTCWSVGMEELKRKRLALQALLETTETRSALVSLRPLHVFAGAGIDFDPFAGLDEERRLDGDAGLQNDWLLDIVGGVPADSVRGIGDFQNDAGRQFN